MAMAMSRGAGVARLYDLLPRVLQTPSLTAACTARTTAVSWSSILPSASITIPAITLNIPGVFSDIWEGILRAVPKKKTSHMKKRHRQLAGKALKDVKSLVQCPACGRPKKAHMLCPYCLAEIEGARYKSARAWRKPKLEVKGVKREGSLVEEGRVNGQEIEATKEKTQEDLEIEQTENDRRQIGPVKEEAGPTAERLSLNQQVRLPGRSKGEWRNELKYL